MVPEKEASKETVYFVYKKNSRKCDLICGEERKSLVNQSEEGIDYKEARENLGAMDIFIIGLLSWLPVVNVGQSISNSVL